MVERRGLRIDRILWLVRFHPFQNRGVVAADAGAFALPALPVRVFPSFAVKGFLVESGRLRIGRSTDSEERVAGPPLERREGEPTSSQSNRSV